jgi:hypothetical protein
MAKHFNLIQVATPTGLTPALQAGGGLTPGVTYYYRIIAVRYYDNKAVALSAPGAEVSTTADATNKTIALTWDAMPNADGYIVQRTTTSGSYPIDGNNSFTLYGRPYSTSIYATTLTNLTDDGGATSRVRFDGRNMDFSQEFPVLEAYGDSTSDIITLADLLDEASFSGFIDVIAPAGLKALKTNTYWREEAPYIVYGSLYIHKCTFRLRGMLMVYGHVRIYVDVKLEAGDKTYYYSPYILTLAPASIPYTNDNDSYANYFTYGQSIGSVAGSFARNLIRRPINARSLTLFNYYGLNDEGIPSNLELLDSIVGLNSSNAMPFVALVASNNIFESLRLNTKVLQDAIIRFSNEGNCFRWTSNQRAVRCKTLDSAYDLVWGNQCAAVEIDCIFQGKGQTDNQPYYACQCNNASYLGHTLLRQNSFTLKVADQDGNPINGAEVTLVDTLGNSDIWEDSLAIFLSTLNNTDVSSSLTVSDGTKFSIGDVIRLETYGELLLVTNIVGNVLIVSRGYGGTDKRATSTGNSNRVLKQVASLTTGVDGVADCDEAVTAKELVIARSDGSYFQAGYEDDLVATGYLDRNMRTPHTLTITKEGYQDYQDVITIDRSIDLEVALSPVPPPVYVPVPSGEMDIILAAPEPLEVALESDEIKVELSEAQ